MIPPVLAIVGPTASGKSAIALELAEARGLEIVSCDSMQVYRGLDVGTAKPPAGERARVRHHLVDVAEPDETFSAMRYVELADRAIDEIRARGREPLLVGGTGLYLRALRWGLASAPPRDPALREALYQAERERPGTLHARLVTVDPESAARIAPRDLVRLVRALEVAELSGRPLSRHHAEHAPVERRPMRVLVLDPPREELAERIAARTRAMIEGGLIDETRRLVARYGAGLPALQSIGYRQVLELLAGRLAPEALEAAIASATRAYARRQRTWFKKERDVRFHPSAASLLADLE